MGPDLKQDGREVQKKIHTLGVPEVGLTGLPGGAEEGKWTWMMLKFPFLVNGGFCSPFPRDGDRQRMTSAAWRTLNLVREQIQEA